MKIIFVINDYFNMKFNILPMQNAQYNNFKKFNLNKYESKLLCSILVLISNIK